MSKKKSTTVTETETSTEETPQKYEVLDHGNSIEGYEHDGGPILPQGAIVELTPSQARKHTDAHVRLSPVDDEEETEKMPSDEEV